MRVGLDIGSTTIKCVVLDEHDRVIYDTYERHGSHITEKAGELLARLAKEQVPGGKAYLAISGSAGMGLADGCGVPFVQEVFATRVAAKRLAPQADVVIELGGEDAKILFLSGGTEVRMNGSCAGGTGAFIDQMATLLKMSPEELNKAASRAEKTYTIASRCGVFAKSDIQPLINQGAAAGDIAASIYQAVVNQTIAGLAQGRPIQGNVLYLGGPLTFNSELRKSFDHTLELTGLCPEHSLHFVAMGAAFYADREMDLAQVAKTIGSIQQVGEYTSQPPLFANKQEYEDFHARHMRASVPCVPFGADVGPVHIGVDSGSTTVKVAVIDDNANLLFTDYQPNLGNPLPLIRDVLLKLYQNHPNLEVASVTSTGYGEELVKHAFRGDFGVVETVAHFTAARHFLPDVDFIIDIGGQFTPKPVNLGSRCTVFMNSSVKQAQKDGASIQNISAGLSISVVKNAIYKVIRAASPEELGRRIVVQGGTFYNEAVLRAFEKEMGVEVVRPDIAGLMGAFGAALHGRSLVEKGHKSSLLSRQELLEFTQKTQNVQCNGCTNHCQLTVSTFAGGRRLISGNRCEKPVTGKTAEDDLNLYAYKQKMLAGYKPGPAVRGTIGIPLCLNMYELLPFWHAFFTSLGFAVVTSPVSTRAMYIKGQASIPSDTVCFPAKLAHGHIRALADMGIKTIFYPCMSYNIDEHLGDNHYNCPVVAYYPEVLAVNCPELADVTFINEFVGLHRPKDFKKKMYEIMNRYFPGIKRGEVERAADMGYAEYNAHMQRLRDKGAEIIAAARAEGKRIVVLAGRPYHVDPEVNHGIDALLCRHGAAVITEDSVAWHEEKFPTTVLNQWTYHSRLYAAAKYCTTQKDMDLVQLVSFGCGVDAITTDETREILHEGGKLYTQLKIDEITNLGAVNIRIRSLFAALDEKERKGE